MNTSFAQDWLRYCHEQVLESEVGTDEFEINYERGIAAAKYLVSNEPTPKLYGDLLDAFEVPAAQALMVSFFENHKSLAGEWLKVCLDLENDRMTYLALRYLAFHQAGKEFLESLLDAAENSGCNLAYELAAEILLN